MGRELSAGPLTLSRAICASRTLRVIGICILEPDALPMGSLASLASQIFTSVVNVVLTPLESGQFLANCLAYKFFHRATESRNLAVLHIEALVLSPILIWNAVV